MSKEEIIPILNTFNKYRRVLSTSLFMGPVLFWVLQPDKDVTSLENITDILMKMYIRILD